MSSLTQPKSFKDVLKPRPSPLNPKDLYAPTFVVEQEVDIPSLEVDNVICRFVVAHYKHQVIICCFNDFCHATSALQEWVHQNWPMSSVLYFYSKGFFVVLFNSLEDR